MFARPLFSVVMLTYFIAIYLIVQGVIEILMALSLRSRPGWGWALLSAIVNFALGVLLLKHWPLSGLWAIGVMIGINIVMSGITLVGFGSAAKALKKEAAATA